MHFIIYFNVYVYACHQDSLELVVCHFNVHNVDYGYEWCVFFFLIYAEAIYRTGSIVNSPCLPFSMGMKKKVTQ